MRIGKRRARARAAVTAESGGAVARNRGDDARTRSHLADAIIAGVRDVHVARRVHRDTLRIGKRRARACAAVATESIDAVARNRGDDARTRGHLADAIVVDVRDVHVARRIHCDVTRVVKLRARARAAVAAESKDASARDRGDDARAFCHLTDAMISIIRDVHAARRVHRDACGEVQLRARARAAVAAESLGSIAHDGGDDARK